MSQFVQFRPTRTWLSQHKSRPEQCPDTNCHCSINHMTDGSKAEGGLCTGIRLNVDLDNISFCYKIFDEPSSKFTFTRSVFHPSEAQLIATMLSIANMELWLLLPGYRKELGEMLRKRSQKIGKVLKKSGTDA